MSPTKFIGVLIVLASLLIGGCRITVTPIVSLSQLRDSNVRSVPVAITANVPMCDVGSVKKLATAFKDKYLLRPIGCRPAKNGMGADATWQAELPLLRSGDEAKMPRIAGSLYYSRNNSILLVLKPDFIRDIKQQAALKGYNPEYSDVVVSLIIRNDSREDVDIAVENVFVNEVPVGREMQIFRIKPGGAISIRLSDISIDTLFLGGVEAVGVFPALRMSEH